jgi:hypothetical protein
VGSLRRGIASQTCLGQKDRNPYLKNAKAKRARCMAQMIEHLPSKSKASEFNTQYCQKKKKKKAFELLPFQIMQISETIVRLSRENH